MNPTEALLLPLGAVIVLHWWAQATLFKHLRSHHAPQWQALGSPSITSAGVGSRFRYFRFVWRGGARELEDAKVARLVQVLRSLDLVGAAILVLGTVLALR